MIKSSNLVLKLSESCRRCDGNSGVQGEWTYEGDRKSVSSSSSRRGVPVTVQLAYWCEAEWASLFANQGGTAGIVIYNSCPYVCRGRSFYFYSKGDIYETVNKAMAMAYLKAET